MRDEIPGSYADRKAFFDDLLTIYGRKPVHEALNIREVMPYRLHLAKTNRPIGIITEIIKLARSKNVEIKYHDRQALSRLSKNGRQDQGVVLDIKAPLYQPSSKLDPSEPGDLIALENVTNPQNVGMTIRSVGASPCAGIILPRQGCAKIDALVMKASAGTALKVPIFHCEDACAGIASLKDKGFRILGLSSSGPMSLASLDTDQPTIFVLGNETKGLSEQMQYLCDDLVRIPLNNQVESLNVSVAASIVAFRSVFSDQ
ncbi:MAG: RNA methyltransferase [bacterium]|nr:RNA methyltransferase [Gammaproteobacteria bacterium]HIL98981.1 RNA methyltransferase [Pseudomonadales bacterium]